MKQTQTQGLPVSAKLYVGGVVLASTAGIFFTFAGWTPDVHGRFILYLLIAVVSSGMKVTLPDL